MILSTVLGFIMVALWIWLITWAFDSDKFWEHFNRFLLKCEALAETVRKRK